MNIMTEKLRCQLFTLQEVYDLSYTLAERIGASGFEPDMIIAVARGGYIPARLLCDFLNIKDMTSITVRHYTDTATKLKQAKVLYPVNTDISDRNILVVDDVNDTGDTLRVAMQHLNTLGATEIRTAVLHEKEVTQFKSNYNIGYITDWHWLIYPWAAVEDVGGIIRKEYSEIKDLIELRNKLIKDHEIKISIEMLDKVTATLE